MDTNGYLYVKKNEKNEITRYKAWLVAQDFSQRLGIDYEETYTPVMDAITFRFLISLVAKENLDMWLMDVVTTYLYGSLNNDIYMKLPERYIKCLKHVILHPEVCILLSYKNPYMG